MTGYENLFVVLVNRDIAATVAAVAACQQYFWLLFNWPVFVDLLQVRI